MNQEEYNYKIQVEALDKIDFLPYIKKYKGKNFYKLVNEIEERYDGSGLTDNDVLDGYIFNYFSEDEIVNYLEKRYGNEFRVQEITQYNIC